MAIEKRWVKITTYVILGLMVVGFSVPGFLDFEEKQVVVEPKLCHSDAECYLLCDDLPVEVFCSQNLCLKNSCTESSYYEYNSEPLVFNLAIKIEGNETILEEDSGDFFVKFKGETVELYSSGLSLGHVLEKAGGYYFESGCLLINGKKHCDGNLTINGNESYQGNSFVPQEGDLIKIIYS